MASTLLRRRFPLLKRGPFRSFATSTVRCRPDTAQTSKNNVFDTHTVEDLHGLSASEILAETGTRADTKLRHFTVNFG
ncbi:hypothetical protein M404DRAFT_528874 [Pisolithus tinctorius Marx 270]|uniref:Uncharacterized protein n=1 Tax=Pisolithus tinctorius Marx 270 TaxID=870435 RepID=A0A0C3MWG0_PISTI|nr:hypothetical protein M404DRAFT_528874 [Pisolithus tinctorius Marx 270]